VIGLEGILVLAGVLVLVSVLASKASGRLGIPAMLIFLALGMLAGSEGPGGIEFDDAQLAQSVGIVALVLILFSGGLDTSWQSIRPVLRSGVLLATLGVALTALTVGVFAAAVSELTWRQGLLLGAVVSSTDAAAVFAVLRSRGVPLREDVRSLLELESGSNDPMAVFLTVGLVALLTGEMEGGAVLLIPAFLLQMGLGAAFGLLMSKGMVWLLNWIQLGQDGLYPVLSLALIVLTYGGTAYVGGNGFLAVYVAGVVMGNSVFIHKRSLTRFHDGLAWLGQIVMFLTLGLLAFPSEIVGVVGVGLLVSVFLILVARPVAVYLVLLFSRIDMRGRTLISLVGLRGAVPIILATFPLVADVPNANVIFDLVFFIVLTSALLQGSTIPWMARRLKVTGEPFSLPLITGAGLPGGYIAEHRVPGDSVLIGRQIAKMGLPANAHVLLVHRYDGYLVATGGMRLRRDDVLIVMGDADAHRRLGSELGLVPQGGLSSVCMPPPGSLWGGPHTEGPRLDESAGGEPDRDDD
jgi:potassium/hydrogen antiporter